MMRGLVIYLFLVFALAVTMQAQNAFDCRLTAYTEHDGLSQGRITSMVQDRDGVLWIGSWDGLHRFDGYRFTCYKASPGNREPLVQNRFDNIVLNNEGDIWCVGRKRFYLFRTRERHFVDINSMLEKKYGRKVNAYKISVLGNGFTWLLDDDGTLFCVEDADIEHVEFYPNPGAGERRIYDIRSDSRGNSWLLTDKGVAVVGDIPFKSETVYKSWAEKDGCVWLGTPKGVISIYNPATGSLSFLENMPREVKHLNRMRSVGDSTLLMLTNAGAVLIDTRTRETQLLTLPATASHDVVYSYKLNANYTLLISSDKRLYRLDMTTREIAAIQRPDTLPAWLASDVSRPLLFKNGRGELYYFLREGGLYRIDMEALTMRPYNAGRFLSPIVRLVFPDRQGNIWIGTNVGLHKLQFADGAVEPHAHYMKDEVRCLFADSRGRMWVTSRLGDVEVWEDDRRVGYLAPDGRLVPQKISFGSGVYAIYEDRSHNLWLGTKGEGLFRLRYHSSRQYVVTGHYLRDSNDMYSIDGDAVYAIMQDSRNRLWVGCYDGGLNMLENPDAERVKFLHESNRLGVHSAEMPREVRCVAEVGDSVILVGTTHGFYTFAENFSSPETVTFYRNVRKADDVASLGSNDIMGIEVTRGGEVYLAVFGGGLNKVLTRELLSDDLQFRHYMKNSGAYSDVTLNLVEDTDGYIWVQTERMLMRFDPKTENFENIGSDVLPRYVTLSENKPLLDAAGRLLVPTIQGVYVVSPDKIVNDNYCPAIVFGEGLDSLVLTPEEKTLSVPFAAVDFSSNLPVRYAYMLQGVDKGWTVTQENLTANYVNLPAGTFYLRVKSTNRSGLWADNERVLPVTREPRFSETPWAITLYALLVVAGVVFLVFIYLHIYKLRYKLRLEHRLTESKLRFFTDISHELRTPLTLIEGPLSEVLADENLPEEDREYLTVAQTNTHRMLNLINQILDFRKIQNEKMRLLVERLDVRATLVSLMETFDNLARQHHIDFRLEAPDEIYVWADRDKFEKIFVNLISNAFKYTPQGKRIVVSVQSDELHVTVTVQDQGVGIQPSKLDTLFRRFDTILADNLYMQSTGIGLSLVKSLVDLHHARITVDSTVGEGSAFVVAFLVGKKHFDADEQIEFLVNDDIPAGDLAPTGGEEMSDVEEDDGHSSILVVEDNDDLRAFLYSCLHREYKVYTAVDGEEGWRQTLEYMPDLVITDLMMPVVDGFELAGRIKNDTTTCHIPIVALTAKNTLDDRLRSADSGIAEYMLKPFSTQLLKARVAMILQQQQMLREKYMEQFGHTVGDDAATVPADVSLMPADEQFMRRLMAYIEAHIENPDLSVEDLAQEMALSRSVFFRKMKALVGQSPVNFLQVVRIQRAIQLMQTKNFSISEVAYRVGYTDPKYFSRSFKKITGKSPSTYLQSE